MENRLIKGLSGIVLDCGDAGAPASFYERLLGWERTHDGGGWAGLTAPNGMVLAVQTVPDYRPPVWPRQPGTPGQMRHLDFLTENLTEAAAHAVVCGARLADVPYFETSRTLPDPAGHPFCLDTAE